MGLAFIRMGMGWDGSVCVGVGGGGGGGSLTLNELHFRVVEKKKSFYDCSGETVRQILCHSSSVSCVAPVLCQVRVTSKWDFNIFCITRHFYFPHHRDVPAVRFSNRCGHRAFP